MGVCELHDLSLEMVCVDKASMHTFSGPALGFQSIDKLYTDDHVKDLCFKSYKFPDKQSASQTLSCHDLLNPPNKPKMPIFNAAASCKSTGLVEGPLLIQEQEHTILGTSIDVISVLPCNTDGAAPISWHEGNTRRHLQRSIDAVEHGPALGTPPARMPSIEYFKDILQEYRKSSSSVNAEQVHLRLCEIGLENHRELGNFLVPMLLDCGNLDMGWQAFYRLTYRREHSWTSLIQGHVASEQSDLALELYHSMVEDFIDPSYHTFVILLKACSLLFDVERGNFFHSEVVMKGLEQNAFVGSALVDMYSKCGSLADARHTLNEMSEPDVVLWTSMISGYVEYGFSEEALICMEEVRNHGLSPDIVTISCWVKACTDLGVLHEGHKLHMELDKMGFSGDVFVGIALMDMYAKCGSLSEVIYVFEGLCLRDQVSWTAMIMAYVEHDCSHEAFNCLESMQVEGVSPVAATFVCILKACVTKSDVENGSMLHQAIVKRGFEGDLLVGNSLVDMYAKCGSFAEAREVLAKLPIKDAVPWTALIAGYLEQGDIKEVLKCFEQIEMEGVPLDGTLFMLSLKSSGSLGVLDKGQAIHSSTVKVGLEGENFIGNTLVGMYAKCGAIYEANDLFSKLSVRSVVSWNALLAGYSKCGPFDEAWRCFSEMQSEGVLMDTVTCVYMLKACGNQGASDKGREVHGKLAKKGYETDFLVASALVDMYGKCGSVVEAQNMFDRLMVQDLVTWNALLQAYAVQNLDEEALNCFKKLQLNGLSPDETSWSLMIMGCTGQRGKDRACMYYASMLEQGLLPNNAVFVSVLKACGELTSIETIRRIHAQVCSPHGSDSIEMTMITTVIDSYSKCGSMWEAQQVFTGLTNKPLAVWSALTTGYARQGNSKLVFHLLMEMAKEGIQPDEGILLGVLSVCSHEGLVNEGQKFFETMCDCWKVSPQLEHHTCMVDLFGRAGHLEGVVTVMEELPVKPDAVMWRSVMDACSKWGARKVLGSKALKEAMSLGKQQASLYISMTNLYAEVGAWENYNETKVVEVG